MSKPKLRQGDIVWLNFSPSRGAEMRGTHPAVVVSSNKYNRQTSFIRVCPITSQGNHFKGYVPLHGYVIKGRINTIQLFSFSSLRIINPRVIDHLRNHDLQIVKRKLQKQLVY